VAYYNYYNVDNQETWWKFWCIKILLYRLKIKKNTCNYLMNKNKWYNIYTEVSLEMLNIQYKMV
jgi:hypothetical protein